MNEKIASHIGGWQGIKSVGIGLLIVHLFMAWVTSDFPHALIWFLDVDYKLNILIGVAITLVMGFVSGMSAGRAILINGTNAYLVGLLFSLVTLFSSVVLAGLTGFFQEGIQNERSLNEAAYDYIIKPALRMSIIGIMPAIFAGFWFGYRLKAKMKIFGNKENKEAI